jgi:peptidoglycan biosynthesis protein MviN/MurJ (putative lipid II flippase)
MTLSLTLWNENYFINNSIPKDGLLVLFYGVMLGLLIYIIFLLLSIRKASYLYLPYCFFNFLNFIIGMIYGFVGFTIMRLSPDEAHQAEPLTDIPLSDLGK